MRLGPFGSPSLGDENFGRRTKRLTQSAQPLATARRKLLSTYVALEGWPNFRPALLVLVAAWMGLLVAPDLRFTRYPTDPMMLGMPVTENIKAPFDVDVVDDDATARSRHEAAQRTQRVFDYDTALGNKLTIRIKTAFSQAQHDASDSALSVIDLRRNLEIQLGVAISLDGVATFRRVTFAPAVAEAIGRMLAAALDAPVVVNKSTLLQPGETAVRLQRIAVRGVEGRDRRLASLLMPKAQGIEILAQDIDGLRDLEQARRMVRQEARVVFEPHGLLTGQPELLHQAPNLPEAILALATSLLQANVSPNIAATEVARAQAMDNVKPMRTFVKKGEMIIRDGERLSNRHLMVLRALAQNHQGFGAVSMAIGGTLLVMVVLFLVGASSPRNQTANLRLSARDLMFLALAFVLSMTACRTLLLLSRALGDVYTGINRDIFMYCLPVAAGTILVRLVLRAEAALIFAVTTSLALGLLADGDRMLIVYSAVGSIAALRAMASISQRGDVLRAGMWAAVMQAAAALGIQLFEATTGWQSFVGLVPAALLSGFMAGVLALSLAPLVEWAFDYTSDLKLLELANLNHPALKELIVQAPGSYHHSIVVGALVEAAAEQIGAHSLMARVMAYYHDLGKGCNAHYFIENQLGGRNPHDKIKPSMSAMVIRRHVTDGLELARQYALGEPILAGIAQHHGTTLISIFYNKAIEASENKQDVSEADYRYPGPKPQSREAAVVMLGDSIEAAARAMAEPTPARLKGLVTRIIDDKFTDGQLEECDLTLRDLRTIAKSFTHMLNSIYHHRIEYPDVSRHVFASSGSSKSVSHSGREGQQQAFLEEKKSLGRLG